ncbi:MAG: DUF1576 domain-containing protein [Oscillibacter sp.]|nr:DUF1576 domain-containing protein [Oscillibacter sp.]
MKNRYEGIFWGTILVSSLMILIGFALDGPASILRGMIRIVTMQDLLITDYVLIGGVGAALVNSGLLMMISICIIKFSGDPYNGFTIAEMGLMAGFAMFGKNLFNTWPIILGTWLYAKYQKEPFSKHASVALLATALSPLVSYMALGSIHASLPLGIAVGLVVGFILPPLSAYTYRIQNGMNLYNMGFACGLFAMMVVPILTAFGDKPTTALYWEDYQGGIFMVLLSLACASFILFGSFGTDMPAKTVWSRYWIILSDTTGRAPSDYLRMFGAGPVLVNIGVNGIIGMLYILLVGGQLNGPTVGGIFTIMGFSAFGKNAFNIIPVMLGVYLGAYGMHYTPDYPALQLAGLFGTCLAPISGHFGWPYGILAGFIHSALVLQTGGPVAGLNLYNNGFSGGLIAIVLYPTITAIARHRRPHLQEHDYYELFEASEPADVNQWGLREKWTLAFLKRLFRRDEQVVRQLLRTAAMEVGQEAKAAGHAVEPVEEPADPFGE